MCILSVTLQCNIGCLPTTSISLSISCVYLGCIIHQSIMSLLRLGPVHSISSPCSISLSSSSCIHHGWISLSKQSLTHIHHFVFLYIIITTTITMTICVCVCAFASFYLSSIIQHTSYLSSNTEWLDALGVYLLLYCMVYLLILFITIIMFHAVSWLHWLFSIFITVCSIIYRYILDTTIHQSQCSFSPLLVFYSILTPSHLLHWLILVGL